MASNLLYLSPHFPKNFINFVLRLKDAGVRVFGVGGDYFGELPQNLQQSMTEYYRVAWMDDYPQVLEAARYFDGKYGHIERIESHAEHWLFTEGALREDLNVRGKKRAETALVRYKSRMKSCFIQAGIPVVPGKLATTPDEAHAFVDQVGYPIVAKPDSGVGARATYRIENQIELGRFLDGKGDAEYFLEPFVEGEIHTFDGLTDSEGRVVYCNSLKFPSGVMETVNADEHLFYCTMRKIEPRLEELGHRAVRAFDIREKFFHVEFFAPNSRRALLPDEYVAIEMNARPPGNLTVDMWNYADDIDLYAGWASMISSGTFGVSWSRRNHVGYVSRKDRFNYRHSHEEVLRHAGSRLVHWERTAPLFRGVMGDTSYLLRAERLADIEGLAQMIHCRL